MNIIWCILAVGLMLVVNEWWWHKRGGHHGEISRKLVHILVGSFVAVWPFFLSWPQIISLSAAFLVVVAASKYLGIFKAIHSVTRPTWGEVFFALAVGAVALITHHKGVYAAALLQMSLADGLAAVAGVKFGQATRYKVLGATKSLVGTSVFFAVSVMLLAAYQFFTHDTEPYALTLAIAGLATAIENFGVYGLDNLLVPLAVALMLGR